MKLQKYSLLKFTAAIGLCYLPISAQAGLILKPSALSGGSIAGASYTYAYAGDQSGLSATYTSGVDDFATTLATLTHAVDAANTGWASVFNPTINIADPLSGNNYLTIDMGSAVAVSRIGIWVGLDGPGGTNFSATNEFEVFSATDATYTSLTSLGVFNLPDDSPGTGIAFDITDTTSQYFLLNVRSLYANANKHGSFGEVAFEAVPEPGSLALMGIGGLLIVRRRRG